MQVTKGMTITVRYFKEDTAHPEVPAVGNYITLTGKADRIDPVFRTQHGGNRHPGGLCPPETVN